MNCFPLIADENIHPDVIAFLRKEGNDVRSVAEEGLLGQNDLTILRHAHREKRIVITHDSDFGTLAIAHGEPFIGIIYLRPGHIRAELTIRSLRSMFLRLPDLIPPFIVVAEYREQQMKIRLRQLNSPKG